MKTIIAICTIIGFAFGAYFYVEDRYAHCEDVKKIEQRLDYKIVSDQFHSIQQRMWQLLDRYKTQDNMPPSVKEEYRKLESDKKMMEKKIEALEKK